MQEDADRSASDVTFARAPAPGDHVRRRGEDLRKGAPALSRGTRLSAFELSLASALDRTELSVARRPSLGIICTGDELRAAGEPPKPGSVPESNGIAIAALARGAGAQVQPLLRNSDDVATLSENIRRLAQSLDVLVTIGGASVGDHDLALQALTAAGAVLDFWKVKIKPGKPFLLGRLGRTTILGLPGNPVSAQLTFVLFGLPLLRALQGDRAPAPERGRATLAAPLTQKPGRLGLYRARLEGDQVFPHENQASGSTASLAQADVVVLVPEDSAGYAAGSSVEIIRLPRP
jgi:molybdopterin molybdotransferase